MDVSYAGDAVRRQVLALTSARPDCRTHWAQRTLLTLVDSADSLQDLATTASSRLVRLTLDPCACFRYASTEAAVYLYPTHPNGAPMSIGQEPRSFSLVRAVQIAAIQ